MTCKISNSTSTTLYSPHNLPEADRPRERLLRQGSEAMTTAELIAIVLGSGIKGVPILQLAQEIMVHFGTLDKLAGATVEELCQIRGLGPAKALQLRAAFIIGLRLSKREPLHKTRIENPSQAYRLVKDRLERESRELFLVILLDSRGCTLSEEVISIGTLTNAQAHPREVFYPAIRHHAASIILVHNHPSGDPTPSQQDYDVTHKLINVGHLMGIPVHDHLIVGYNSFVSLRQEGKTVFACADS